MANYGDQYSYQVAFSATGEQVVVRSVQDVARETAEAAKAAREQAAAAREAAKEQAKAAREQAAEAKRAAAEQARAAREAAAAQARAARDAAREQARAARDVAREQAEAARQAAREQAAEAKRAARDQEAAARQAEAAVKQSAREQAAAQKRMADETRAASSRAGQAIGQLAYIMDDAAYGARGLRNQIIPLSTSLFGFGPAAAAAGLAGTVLVGVFSKQIDRVLAYAGVLDENLVKGMEKGEKATNQFKESVESLNKAFEDSPRATREMAASIATMFDDAGREVTEGIVKLIDAASNPNFDVAFESAKKRLEKQIAEVAQAAAVDGPDFLAQGQLMRLEGELRKLEEARGKQIEEARDKLLELQKAAVEGDQGAIVDLYEKAMEAFGRTGDQAFSDLAQSLFEQTEEFRRAEHAAGRLNAKIEERVKAEERLAREQKERWEEGERARQEEIAGIFEQMRVEQQAEDARKERVRARREEEARGRLDANTRRVVEAFGPAAQQGISNVVQAGLNRGASPEQAGMQAFAQLSAWLERMGVEAGAAGQAARQMVDEQLPGFQRMVDAWNAQGMMMRDALRNTGMVLQMVEQQRAMMLENARITQAQRDWIARNSSRNRSNMLGTFRPF